MNTVAVLNTSHVDQAARVAAACQLQFASVLKWYEPTQIRALKRIYELAHRQLGTGGGNAAAKVLLGLYNGTRFPFELTELRRFDEGNLDAAIEVIEMDARRCSYEVHEILNAIYADGYSTGCEMENWAFNLRLKGRCTKENLPTRPARSIA